MDAFKMVIVMSIILSLATLGFIMVIANYAIATNNIPNIEYGIVASKESVNRNSTNFMIVLVSGKTIYTYNATLYDGIQVGLSYIFTGYIDYNNQIIVADDVEQFNRTSS